jgi:hypothetical protein
MKLVILSLCVLLLFTGGYSKGVDHCKHPPVIVPTATSAPVATETPTPEVFFDPTKYCQVWSENWVLTPCPMWTETVYP